MCIYNRKCNKYPCMGYLGRADKELVWSALAVLWSPSKPKALQEGGTDYSKRKLSIFSPTTHKTQLMAQWQDGVRSL